jgi:hypothetical protein
MDAEATICMTGRVKLYTSLPPEVSRTIAGAEVGAAYLAQCVRSWRRAGFDVVTLNGACEIDSVVRQGYEVECQRVSHDRPTIDDFLAAVRRSRALVAGIINADVLLIADPELLRIAVAGDGMTLLERINIDPGSMRPTGRSCAGFDAFVFATAPLSQIDQGKKFLFGHPWWDYWFPLSYVAAGGRLTTVKAPVLFHLQHQQKWKHEHYIANGRETLRCLLRSKGDLPDDILTEIRKFGRPDEMSEAELGRFGSWCFAKLRAMAEPIEAGQRTGGSSPLMELVTLLDDQRNRNLIGELDDAEARVLAAVEMSRAIYQLPDLIGGQQIESDEDARRMADRAAQILASRKAALSHFWTLNVRSFKSVVARWL